MRALPLTELPSAVPAAAWPRLGACSCRGVGHNVGSPELWPATPAARHRSSVWTVMSWVPTTERSRRASADRLVEAERLDLSQYAVARGPVQEAVSTVSAPRWRWIRIMYRADAGSMEAWLGHWRVSPHRQDLAIVVLTGQAGRQ